MATQDLNSTFRPATPDVLRRAGMRSLGVLRNGAIVAAVPGPDGDLIACVGVGGGDVAVHYPVGPWTADCDGAEYDRAAAVAEQLDVLAYPESGILWVIAWPWDRLPFDEAMQQATHRVQAAARAIRDDPPGLAKVGSVQWCRQRALLAGLPCDPDGGVLIPAASPSLLWFPGDGHSRIPSGTYGVADEKGVAAFVLRTEDHVFLAIRSAESVGAWWESEICDALGAEDGVSLQLIFLDRPDVSAEGGGDTQEFPWGTARVVGGPRRDPSDHAIGSADWAYATASRHGQRHPDSSVQVSAPGTPPIWCNRGGAVEAAEVPDGAFGHSDCDHVVYVARVGTRVTVRSNRGARDPYAALFLRWLLDAGVPRTDVTVSRIRSLAAPLGTDPERLPPLDIKEDR